MAVGALAFLQVWRGVAPAEDRCDCGNKMYVGRVVDFFLQAQFV